MNRRVLGVIGLWVVTLAPAVAFSQSLADTAKAEQARRKNAAPAGTPKVYTESDLPASLPKTQSELDAEKAAANSSARKTTSTSATSAGKKGPEPVDPRTWEPSLEARIAVAEKEVQRLGKLPTGGGKVCKIPEGVFVPGVTAPEQVVCPYQMESRYDEAKRILDDLKSQLAAQQSEKTRRR